MNNVTAAYEQGQRYAGAAGAAYTNAMNTVTSTIQQAQAIIASPLGAITDVMRGVADTIQFVQSFPGDFVSNMEGRFGALTQQFDRLTGIAEGGNLNNEEKGQFVVQAGAIITTMTTTSVQQTIVDENGDFIVIDQEYESISSVLSSIEIIVSTYNSFILTMDGLQTENGGTTESFIPNFNAMLELENSVNTTVSNLFNIALESQQERTVILEKDSNAIVLAHRFYGLDVDDVNLEKFVNSNQLGLLDYLTIRKNTPITYFV